MTEEQWAATIGLWDAAMQYTGADDAYRQEILARLRDMADRDDEHELRELQEIRNEEFQFAEIAAAVRVPWWWRWRARWHRHEP